MNIARCLRISLCLNIALVVVVVYAARRRPTLPGASGVSRALTHRSLRLARKSVSTFPGQTLAEAHGEMTTPFHWSQVESQDYRIYVANLRAIGCPAPTLRDIIVADVQELFNRRVDDLVDGVQNRFWELLVHKDELEKVAQEKEAELEALKKERDAVLEELLGAKGTWRTLAEETADYPRIEARKEFLDFMPADKITQVLAADEKFSQMVKALSASEPPLAPNDFQARYKALQEQAENERQQLLSPEEIAEYKLRSSRFADLANRPASFDASEDQLKQIIRIQEKFAAALDSKEPNVDARVTQRAEAQKQQTEEIKQLLGEARFTEYERAQDTRYQELYQLADRLQLPSQVATDVFEMRKTAEDQARRLRSDLSIPAEQRAELLTAIRQETERSIAQAFGPKPFEIYQSRWGQWLNQLDGEQP